jgi:hypothetical protein
MKIHHEGTKRSLQKLEISSTNSAANFHQPISHSNSLSHLESERERERGEPHSVYATTRYGPNSLNISLIL